MKIRKFSSAAAILVTVWVLTDIVLGFVRNPLDDQFTGNVGIINGNKIAQVDATMTLDMLEKGFTINRRPGIYNTGVRLSFEGKDAQTLTALGLPNQFVPNEDSWKYEQGFCQLSGIKTEGASPGITPEHPRMNYGRFTFTSSTEGCMPFIVAMTDFDHIEFSTYQRGYLFDRKNVIYGSLERDSRVSLIQRTIMRMRFNSWVNNNPIFGKIVPQT
ncbi:hypothetical protein [Pseudomonas sp. PLMAX]|jgi:hypothetical protein|uniref:hypothetical protein n=1 Tax=Pseudomonas sp. PLMAX TaxID=2201998 RepID=UPI0038B8D7B1